MIDRSRARKCGSRESDSSQTSDDQAAHSTGENFMLPRGWPRPSQHMENLQKCS